MKKLITIVFCLVLIMTVFCACGSESATDNAASVNKELTAVEDTLKSETLSSRKLIKNISLDIETKNYDKYIEELENNVSSIGGYIEASNEENYSNFRTFSATIRVPVNKTDGFTKAVSKNATVKRRSENIQDVTEAYIDIEARIKVFKAEEESLLEILKKAANVNDLISVRERLADVRAQIESYTAQLKSLENKTSYSTITITVCEVEREVKTEGYWSKIGNNIINGFVNIGNFITLFFAFALSAIPYLIIPAIIIIVVLVISLRYKKRKDSNNK